MILVCVISIISSVKDQSINLYFRMGEMLHMKITYNFLVSVDHHILQVISGKNVIASTAYPGSAPSSNQEAREKFLKLCEVLVDDPDFIQYKEDLLEVLSQK